jgi:hypothetical protein
MTRFEELPPNVRALMLAKLAIELRTRKASSIYQLAQKRRTNVRRLWRSICRMAKQPACTIPVTAQFPSRQGELTNEDIMQLSTSQIRYSGPPKPNGNSYQRR